MSWRIGVDVGGTFTDLVALGNEHDLHVAKVPSTPVDPTVGVIDALHKLAQELNLEVGQLLSDCSLFVHGSTVATNTLLEAKGAKVGLLTTRGFRDSLEIRRGARENSWDHRTPFAPVLVPRQLRQGISERIDRNGRVLLGIESGQLESISQLYQNEGVESIAVCLLNAFLNPQHEHEIRQQLTSLCPDVWVSLSSDVAPIIGEYERSSTTVVNAYLAPKVVPYLRRLDTQLNELGLKHPLLLLQSNAGASSITQVAPRPASLLLSGPAAALGALALVEQQTGSNDLISMEIGGTSCDVLMMNDGEVGLKEQFLIAGYHVALPTVDVHTVGAGGGTIARVDAGGMLKAGPGGAGANPGPACYGLGGELPTVCDALLVLGRLAAGPYADGAVKLDEQLALDAIEHHLAKPLNVSPREAAVGVVSILEQNVLHAVQRISIERGLDPSPCTLVAAGGAGPMHGSAIARQLGCRQVYVPRHAGAYCALGMLNTDVRHDVMRVLIADLDSVETNTVTDGFAQLENEALNMIKAEGFDGDRARIERHIALHYAGQQSSIRVAYDDFELAKLRNDFEDLHQRMFGHIQPGGALEITALHVTGVGLIERVKFAPDRRDKNPPKAQRVREVYCDTTHGFLDTPVYRGDDLSPGARLPGPVLIEEQTTTLYAGKDDVVQVDQFGNYLIDIGPSQ